MGMTIVIFTCYSVQLKTDIKSATRKWNIYRAFIYVHKELKIFSIENIFNRKLF